MSAFTALNTTTFPGMLVINKGVPGGPSNMFGRVAVAASGGTAIIPTTESYAVIASITMEDGNTYTSSPMTLPNGCQNLTAQMLVTGGTFTFQVLTAAGTTPNQFTLVNTCRQPVTFNITATPASPQGVPILTSAVVVNQLDTVGVSTVETYTFQGIINGITTETLTTTPAQTGKNVTVQIYQDTVSIGDWPAYSLQFS